MFVKISTREFPKYQADVDADPNGPSDYAAVYVGTQPKMIDDSYRAELSKDEPVVYNEQTGRWETNLVAVRRNPDEVAAVVNAQIRDALSRSDWTQLPDSGVNAKAWAAYRAELRGLSKKEGFPFGVQIPAPPSQSAVGSITIVTMRQARLALLGAGLLDAVGPAIQGLPSPQKEAAEIEWEYSTTVDRDSELVRSLAAAIGMTGDQMDALFATAATL